MPRPQIYQGVYAGDTVSTAFGGPTGPIEYIPATPTPTTHVTMASALPSGTNLGRNTCTGVSLGNVVAETCSPPYTTKPTTLGLLQAVRV